MILFKLLISLVIFSTQMDANGWVTLERPEKETHTTGADERDPSIWVVFSKKIGAEKILINFPEEPTYRYFDDTGAEMEILAKSGGTEYRLQVLREIYAPADFLVERKKALEGAAIAIEAVGELVYWKDGFWYLERHLVTAHHTYLLQTKSAALEGEFHRKFVNSLDVEIDRFHR